MKKRKLLGDLIDAFQYLSGGGRHRKDREGLFTRTCSNKTSNNNNNNFILKKDRFRLDRGNNFFTMSVVTQWKRMPREVMHAQSLIM